MEYRTIKTEMICLSKANNKSELIETTNQVLFFCMDKKKPETRSSIVKNVLKKYFHFFSRNSEKNVYDTGVCRTS